jgi:hypothetical protein
VLNPSNSWMQAPARYDYVSQKKTYVMIREGKFVLMKEMIGKWEYYSKQQDIFFEQNKDLMQEQERKAHYDRINKAINNYIKEEKSFELASLESVIFEKLALPVLHLNFKK